MGVIFAEIYLDIKGEGKQYLWSCDKVKRFDSLYSSKDNIRSLVY